MHLLQQRPKKRPLIDYFVDEEDSVLESMFSSIVVLLCSVRECFLLLTLHLVLQSASLLAKLRHICILLVTVYWTFL